MARKAANTAEKTGAEPAGHTGERGGIQSLERAAAILQTIADARDGIGLSDLAGKLGLHSSTAFHLLKTLVSLGFVTQGAEDRHYRIGTRIFALAAGALDNNTLLTLATPVLERLSATTREAAHLAVLSNGEVIVVARTAAPGMLQLKDQAGAIRPPHATAIGKMLYASLSSEAAERLVAGLELERFTVNTITDKAVLRSELETIRREGIAHDRCELDLDIRCIAVPVRDFAGRVVAALGISGPVWHMSEGEVEKKAGILNGLAAELSEGLGYASSE